VRKLVVARSRERGGQGGLLGSASAPGISGALLVQVRRAFGHNPPNAASRIWIALATWNEVNVGMGYRLAGRVPVIKADVEAIGPEVF